MFSLFATFSIDHISITHSTPCDQSDQMQPIGQDSLGMIAVTGTANSLARNGRGVQKLYLAAQVVQSSSRVTFTMLLRT